MTQWYYSNAQRERLGPVGADDLTQLHRNGQIGADTLVWREGYADWKPWREAIDEVLPAAAATAASPFEAAPTATPATTFATAGPDAPADADANPYRMAEPISPYAPPKAQVSESDGFVAGGRVVYAGFWKRVAASIIDSFVVGIAGAMVGMVFGVIMVAMMGAGGFDEGMAILLQIVNQVVGLALGATYFGWMHSSSMQASIGKLAVGIKVVRGDGSRISFARGFGRYFAYMLSLLTIGIGLIMAGFTDRKRALHDMISDTLVVDKYAYTAQSELQRDELGTVAIVVLCLWGLLLVGIIALFAVAGFAIFGSGMR
ncbi:MAG: RDD family protein [Xanthomonadaceae bacterium]|nr:RDD family protein [Xanthomonadaceae bacterium]